MDQSLGGVFQRRTGKKDTQKPAQSGTFEHGITSLTEEASGDDDNDETVLARLEWWRLSR